MSDGPSYKLFLPNMLNLDGFAVELGIDLQLYHTSLHLYIEG